MRNSAPKAEGMRVEYVPLRELQRWPRNPKNHDGEAIQASIGRFGFVQPIVLDESTGRIVAGHGRLESLTALRDSGAAAPARVEVAGDDWRVPVLRGVAFASEHEAEAFLLADNATTVLGGWDDAALAEVARLAR